MEEEEQQNDSKEEEQVETSQQGQGSKKSENDVSFLQLKEIVNKMDEENPDPAKFFQIRQMAQTLLNRAKRVRRNNQLEFRTTIDKTVLESTTLGQKKKKEKVEILQQLKQVGQQKAIEGNLEQNNSDSEDEVQEILEPVLIKKIKESQLSDKQKNLLIQKYQTPRKDGALFHLNKSKKCYCCKQLYNKVHSFYHSMCLDCGNFNEARRNAKKPDLTGKIAIVTGGRIKIGYLTTLLLLRSGCEVHVTSRFPKDALQRYKQEADYDKFKDKIFIYSLDFRNIQSVDNFCEFFKKKVGKLDYLINNAAQSVKREPSYYNHLIDVESQQLKNFSESDIKVLSYDLQLKEFDQQAKISADNTGKADIDQGQNQKDSEKIDQVSKLAFYNFSESALMNLQPALEGNQADKEHLYPKGVLDSNGIQVDLGDKNSWNQTIEEVPLFEFMETQVINTWAPFIFCQKLKDCMISTPEQLKENKYIVNVSSIEGKFNINHKQPFHPHNNMSKASLNMLTRTVGPHYHKNYNIFMTCVDTGWVSNDMIPQIFLFEDNIYKCTPLDELDGALRVVDPIFQGAKGEKPLHTVFLQNYKISNW